MNHRYLFRAKRADNGEWVEGYLYRLSEKLNPFIMLVNRGGEGHKVDTSTICQCTGLKDKNDKLIFEGDIIKSDDAIGIVKFGKYKNDFHFGYYIHWINYPNLRPELGFWNGSSDVIGNIFANPEMLEVSNE